MTTTQESSWEPISHRHNFRVEVEFDGSPPIRNEAEADGLAREVSRLRGVRGYTVWDIEWECPNCHSRFSSISALRGCCDASSRV